MSSYVIEREILILNPYLFHEVMHMSYALSNSSKIPVLYVRCRFVGFGNCIGSEFRVWKFRSESGTSTVTIPEQVQFRIRNRSRYSSRKGMKSGAISGPAWVHDQIQNRYGFIICSRFDMGLSTVPGPV